MDEGDEKKRVWANGCFDVFHFGHANFLRQAKLMGDYLVAGVHGDADIAENKAQPVMRELERAKMISAVKWVDDVRTGIPYGRVLETLEENACSFCVHGDDIAKDANGDDIYAECKKNGKFRECKRTEGISTTLIIDRILLDKVGGHAMAWRSNESGTQKPHAVTAFGNARQTLSTATSSLNEEFQIHDSGESTANSRRVLEMPEEYYKDKIREFSSTTSKPSQSMRRQINYTQGVFDLFHAGHVDFLEKCRSSSENAFLVVGILTDEETYRLYGSYPVTNTYERALALLSCKFVDKVMIGVPYEITSEFVDDLKVDNVFHGQVWELPFDPYKAVKEKNIFRQVDSGSDVTTSAIIERIIQSREVYCERNAKKPESQLLRVRLQGNNS